MRATAPAGDFSVLDELQLAAAPTLLAALQALARTAGLRPASGRTAIVLDDGRSRHVFASTAESWPPDAPVAAALTLDGTAVGSIQVAGPTEPGDAALADLATVTRELLAARLREVRLATGMEQGRRGAGPDRQDEQRPDAQARLSAVLRAVPDLWFVVDRDDTYLMCSDEAHPLLIEPFERQRGQPFGAVLPAPYDRQAREALAQARRSGEMQRLEYECTTRDGLRRVFEARVAPMGDSQILYLTRDLTELRRMERELLMLQRAVEADAAMPIVVTDSLRPERPIVYCNAAFERLTGYRREEAIGHNCRFLQGDETDQPGLTALRAALAEDRPCTVVVSNRRRGGSTFLNELSVVPIRDAQGVVVQHLGVLHDVTERVRAAERLRLSEELYRSVATAISDGLVVAGPDGRILACNPAAGDTLGCEPASLVGSRLSERGYRLHDGQDRPLTAVDHPVYRVLRGGDSARELPLVLHRPDGTVRRLSLTARALRHAAGSTSLSCLVTFRDVTGQQEAAQALLDKQAAELASRAKSEFLSRMSHEMRTPLNAVIGFTQLLRMQPEGEPAKVSEYAAHILHASEQLLGLVNEVLDLQRIEEGRAVLEPRAIELSSFVEAVLELLRPAAQRRGIALTNQVPAGRCVLADERGLRQVLMNMVSNAVKYNRSGGWVVVSLMDALPGRCMIAVEDTGSGLTDEKLARLFQPFERLGQESSDIEGSGLGLVIARSLVAQMGGAVSLSSVPGAGTLARIELPAADSADMRPVPLAHPLPPSTPRERPAAEPASLRVLYAEDNRINALLFEEAMHLLGGIELRVAEDGADALRIVQGWTPQVLVLDAHLPDMNGHELLARLRALPALAHLPAFMCSADAMPEDLERARQSGFHGYWTKPIEMPRVSAALESLRSTAPA
jgi:PAS domain S-box-containing protein